MRSPETAFDLRAALSRELRAAIAQLDHAADKPKAVHRCRVRLKRARALARVGRACAPGLSSVFNDSARSVMRLLAQARDPHALVEAARLAAKKAHGKTAQTINELSQTLAAEAAAAAPLDVEAARAGLKDLLALAQVWPEASARQIRKGAVRVGRRARAARREGKGSEASAQRHEWRKREKDRLYAALLLGKSWPGQRRRKIGEKLGDVLGHERDALLLVDRLRSDPALGGEGKPARRAFKALRRRCAKLAHRADRLSAHYARPS
jgi:hypothetical protein